MTGEKVKFPFLEWDTLIFLVGEENNPSTRRRNILDLEKHRKRWGIHDLLSFSEIPGSLLMKKNTGGALLN